MSKCLIFVLPHYRYKSVLSSFYVLAVYVCIFWAKGNCQKSCLFVVGEIESRDMEAFGSISPTFSKQLFLYQSVLSSFSALELLQLVFFGKRNICKKAVIKCWWNWLMGDSNLCETKRVLWDERKKVEKPCLRAMRSNQILLWQQRLSCCHIC